MFDLQAIQETSNELVQYLFWSSEQDNKDQNNTKNCIMNNPKVPFLLRLPFEELSTFQNPKPKSQQDEQIISLLENEINRQEKTKEKISYRNLWNSRLTQ
jgi:hypothetical protein